MYQEEPFELFLVLLVIGARAAAGLAQWRYPLRAWAAPLLASWVLIALLPAAMPNHVVQNKTPDLFVAEHLDELTGAHHLLSNDLGAASALAWRLRRSDVTLYDTRGELKYGLSYPEHSQRSVPCGRHPPVALAGTPGRLGCRAAADQQRQRPLPAGAVAGRRRTLPERQPGPGDPAASAPMSAALLLATLLMTGLGQVAQKLTVEHWRLVAADGWTARLRSPWPWLALLALGLGLLCWLLLLQRVEVGSAYPMLALNFVLRSPWRHASSSMSRWIAATSPACC